MRIWRTMLNALWPSRSAPSDRTRFIRREPGCDQEKAVREEETAVAKELSEAKAANARVSMGAIVTASQAMAAESRAQAFLRGMLNEVDKGRGHDGRH
ncbi:hypothetical protein ASF24_04460 [Methylobacterium sp. Leaf86]|nr:hypothetical protein ASF24_04460 [Methylobacterium sp. Leaf86]